MCYSSDASFIMGGLLIALGLVSVAQLPLLRSSAPFRARLACLPFAAVPVLFGAQQISEGYVWLNQDNQHAVRAFTSVAYAFWPVYIPFALLFLEVVRPRLELMHLVEHAGYSPYPVTPSSGCSPKKRVMWLLVNTILGAIVCGCMLAILISNDPIKATVDHAHLSYDVPLRKGEGAVLGALYVNSSVISWFASSVKFVPAVGIVIAIALIITAAVWYSAFASTWCFFCAAISVLIGLVIRRDLKSFDMPMVIVATPTAEYSEPISLNPHAV